MENCLDEALEIDLGNSTKKEPVATGVRISWPQLLTAIALPVIGFSFWLGSISSDIKTLRHDTDQSTGRIDEIWKVFPSLRASALSTHPANAANQQAAKQLIAEAKEKKIPPLSESAVQQAGTAFINSNDPKAWSVGLDFIAYRSTLNDHERPPSNGSEWNPGLKDVIRYNWSPAPGGMRSRLFALGPAPFDIGARMERFGEPTVSSSAMGNSSLLAIGGSIQLDNTYLRHVTLDGVEVHYNGGPCKLDDVVFIDCVFVFTNVPNTRTLGETILSSSKVMVDLSRG